MCEKGGGKSPYNTNTPFSFPIPPHKSIREVEKEHHRKMGLYFLYMQRAIMGMSLQDCQVCTGR